MKLRARTVWMALGLSCAALVALPQTAKAVPTGLDIWHEFSFGGPGTALASGIGTVPATNAPDGNPIDQIGDAPWTFHLDAAATLVFLDLFNSVDQFEIFDNLVSLGTTSTPTDGGTCDADIACAAIDPRYSAGVFILGAGDHSLTGVHTEGTTGAGVFEVAQADASVPEPASLGLLGAALAGFGVIRRRRKHAA